MNFEKQVKDMLAEIKNLNVSPDNLLLAITKLLEIMHAHGLDNEAVNALPDCGITLEIEEA